MSGSEGEGKHMVTLKQKEGLADGAAAHTCHPSTQEVGAGPVQSSLATENFKGYNCFVSKQMQEYIKTKNK